MDTEEEKLFSAIFEGDLATSRLLLENGVDPDCANTSGHPVLVNAIKLENLDAVQLLVEFGADVNGLVNFKSPIDGREEYGYRPIYYAINPRILQYLIDKGAHVDVTSSKGITPLMTFSEWCNLECVRILLRAGANIEAIATTNEGVPITAKALAMFCLSKWQDIYKIDRRKEIFTKIENAEKCLSVLNGEAI